MIIPSLRRIFGLGEQPAGSMRSAAMKGTAWTTFGFGASYAIRLLSTLILTRLLAPDIFGLMSLATVFVTALNMLSDIGTSPSIIRSHRGEDPAFLNTAWSLQVVRGFWVGGLLMALAWPFSWLYNEPRLFPILLALAIAPIMQGFVSISISVCRRRMDLYSLTVQDLVVQFATVFFNVGFAWWLQSVWALVIGSLMGSLLRVIMSFAWLPPYRPRFQFERDAMREMVRFGRWIFVGTLFTYFGGQGQRAVMGFGVSVETLGLITIATTIGWSFYELVTKMLSQVAFPSLARINRERPEDLPKAVAKVKRLILIAILPGFLLISALSQWIIDLLYDARYSEAGGYMAILALNAAIATLASPYQNVLIVKGNSRGNSFVMAVQAVLTVLLLLLGAYLYGVYGMLAGAGLATLLTYFLSVYMARKGGVSQMQYDIVSLIFVAAFYAYAWAQFAHG